MKIPPFGIICLLLAAACTPQEDKSGTGQTSNTDSIASQAATSPGQKIVMPWDTMAMTLPQEKLDLPAKYDLSKIWLTDACGEDGTFGKNYQRQVLFLDSSKRDSVKPDLYRVKGRTWMKGKYTPFDGAIVIRELKYNNFYAKEHIPIKKDDWPHKLKAEFIFMEPAADKARNGIFKGSYEAEIFLHPEFSNATQDESFIDGDGYSNGNYIGKWQAYEPKTPVSVYFFDGRAKHLPDTFDWADGEFSVNPKYRKNGWEHAPYRDTINFPGCK